MSDTRSVITMKMGDLLTAERALTRLSQEKMEFKASMNVSRMLVKVREITKIYAEAHDELVKRLGEERQPNIREKQRGAIGMVTQVKDENLKEYNEEIKKREAIETEIERVPISMSTLKRGCPTCKEEHVIEIEPETLAALGALITD